MRCLRISLLILLAVFGGKSVMAREWKDSTGNFKVEAELLEVRGNDVVLVWPDGKQIVVPIARLSDEDQKYLRSLTAGSPNPQMPAMRGDTKTADSGRPVPLATALKTPTAWQLSEPTLEALVDAIRSEHRINVFLSYHEIGCNQIALDQPLTYRSSGKSLQAELDSALDSTGLGWYTHDDVLVITAIKPCAGAGVAARPVVYRILKGGNPQKLSQEIQQQVVPESWEPRSGNKIIVGLLPSALIIIQKPLVHAELQRKFSASLQAIHAPSRLNEQFKLLDQRGSVSCQRLPLEQVVRDLSQQFQVPLMLDVAALRGDTRVSPDTPISMQLNNVRLATALQLMLSGHELAFDAKSDRVTITSLEASEKALITSDYSARSLAFSGGGNAARGGNMRPALDLLTSIEPSSWETAGGPATIAMTSPDNLRINHSN